MKRKIIQTSVVQESEHTYLMLVALCDDGTLWESCYTDRAGWGDWQSVHTEKIEETILPEKTE